MRRETLSGKSWIVSKVERTTPVARPTRSRRRSSGRGNQGRHARGADATCAFFALPDKEHSPCPGLAPATLVLFHLALAGGEGFALSIARLLVVLVLAGLLQDAGLLDLLLEAPQGAVERLVLPDLNLGQMDFPPSLTATGAAHGRAEKNSGPGSLAIC